MDSLLQLAERVERARVGDQRVMLEQAFNALYPGLDVLPASGAYWPPRLTTFVKMLDAEAFESAAMTLLDPTWFFHVSRFSPESDGRGQAHIYPNRGLGDDHEAEAATPALALTAAALRARALTQETAHAE